jgi:double zinc ribbon protein
MDELTRFARRLVEQLSASKEGVNRAVPIGLVREKILPYRTHRRALMLESVEDYETVLLRLVAGERGFVRTLPAAAAQRCQEELAGANPDLSVLDEVADSTIQITSLAAAQIVGDEGGDVTVSEPPVIASEAKQSRRTAEIASVPAAPRDDGPPRRTAEIATAAPRPRDDSPALATPRDDRQRGAEPVPMTECPHCHHAMPSGRQIVFCPWCGDRLIPFTCARCRTELDSEWRHCITCGAPVKDPYRFT